MIEAIGIENFAKRTQDMLEVDGVDVRLLPCEKYNFTPAKSARGTRRELKDKLIIHFRGARKEFMSLYWDKYLALQKTSRVQLRVQVFMASVSLLWRRIIFK